MIDIQGVHLSCPGPRNHPLRMRESLAGNHSKSTLLCRCAQSLFHVGSSWAFILALCLLAPLPLLGQFSVVSCSHGETGTCRQATTCNQSDIQAAINASSSGGAGYVSPTSFVGDGVYVPAGSCSWGSSTVSWTNKNINLIGNNPSITHSSNAFFVGVSNSGSTAAAFRISGFNFPSQGSGSPLLTMSGNTQSSGTVPTTGTAWAGFFRIDHLTYNYTGSGGFVFVLNGPLFGLFDHLTGNAQAKSHFEFDSYLDAEYNAVHTLPTPILTQFLGEYTGRILSAAPGSSSPGGLGSQYMVYIEDSSFACPANYSGAISDSASGGQRMVFRHNTATSACYHYAHWTRSDEWDGDLYEIYNNSYDGGGGSALYPIRMESGTGVIFNNTFTGYSDTTVHLDDRRAGGGEASPHAYSCDGNTSSPAGRPIIDGNAGDASAPGWPCAGQIGNACLNGGCVRGSGAGGMGSLPLLLWNNGSLGVSVDASNLNYIKTTAHTSTNLNGAKDYCLAATTMPSTCGIYTNSYTPYPWPYPPRGGFVLSTAIAGSGTGTVVCTPSGAGIAAGTPYSCTVTPAGGSTLSSVTGCGGSGTTTYTGTMPSANCTVIPTFIANAAIPGFSPVAGSYGSAQTVTISSGTATICFTIDGSTPTANGAGTCTHGTTYSTPISVSTSETVKAVASKSGFNDSTVGAAVYVINGAASTPTFSPVAGSYATSQSVTISSSTSGATICYTADGSTPTANGAGVCTHGATYSGAVTVSSSLTLKAVASKSTFTDSSTGSAAYVINGAAADPTFSPIAGTYNATQSVSLATTTGGAAICYTEDGSTPTASSGTCTHGTTYSTPISVAAAETIKAIASKSLFSNSSVTSAAYVLQVGAVSFSPVAGTYAPAQSVTISVATTSSPAICYTTDASTPTASGGVCTHGTTYSGAITVSTSQVITAIGAKSGYTDSPVASATYVINGTIPTPTFSPVAGTYSNIQTVTISSTAGATLCYTTDGSTPTGDGAGACTHGTTYSVPISVATSETVKAIGTKSGFTDSAAGSAAYTLTTATPTFSPVAGTYTSVQSVAISSSTSGATLRYTTTGTDPTCSTGTVYSSPVFVASSLTLKAIGCASGFGDSAVGSAAYVINIAGPKTKLSGNLRLSGKIGAP